MSHTLCFMNAVPENNYLTGEVLIYADSQSSLRAKKDDHNVGKLSPDATSYAPTSLGTSSEENKSSHKEVPEDSAPVKTQGAKQSTTSRGRPGSSTSSTSDCGGVASASSGPVLSPSSSVVSLSSEKSTLNPYAKVGRDGIYFKS